MDIIRLEGPKEELNVPIFRSFGPKIVHPHVFPDLTVRANDGRPFGSQSDDNNPTKRILLNRLEYLNFQFAIERSQRDVGIYSATPGPECVLHCRGGQLLWLRIQDRGARPETTPSR